MEYTREEKETFMREALKEAEIALDHDEIPIGCVIVKNGEIIGCGHNAREELQRAVMHAEIMAIEEANAYEKAGDCWTRLFLSPLSLVSCAAVPLVWLAFRRLSMVQRIKNLAQPAAFMIF